MRKNVVAKNKTNNKKELTILGFRGCRRKDTKNTLRIFLFKITLSKNPAFIILGTELNALFLSHPRSKPQCLSLTLLLAAFFLSPTSAHPNLPLLRGSVKCCTF